MKNFHFSLMHSPKGGAGRGLLFFFLVVVILGVSAQQQMPNVPLDPAVKVGVLPNGLTYYIRHNEWPEKRADFYIA